MSNQGRGYMLAKRYRIKRRLGAGTSATVFEADDINTGRTVAVKVVHHLFRKDPTIRKRFLREAEAVRALITPHAVKVLDVGELPQGIPYLVMELLSGSTLERIIRHDRGGMQVEHALRLTDQIAAGLQDAHGVDIVHRDLKPENIFVLEAAGEPFVKIVDFGISKLIGGEQVSQLTATGVLVGTPMYMAPEQIEGWKDIDGRVDVYALGVVMYEMLAGESPFAPATDFASLLRMLMSEPPNLRRHRPDVPEALASLIARAMMPDRGQRLSNIESLRLGIGPHWSGRRPSRQSYEILAPMADEPDAIFEPQEAVSTTRRRVLESMSPSKRAPPPPRPAYGRAQRPPRPPMSSDAQLVRPPMESSVEKTLRNERQHRRQETDVQWPPELEDHRDDDGS